MNFYIISLSYLFDESIDSSDGILIISGTFCFGTIFFKQFRLDFINFLKGRDIQGWLLDCYWDIES